MFASILDTRAPEHLTIRTESYRDSQRYDFAVYGRRSRRVSRSARRTRRP